MCELCDLVTLPSGPIWISSVGKISTKKCLSWGPQVCETADWLIGITERCYYQITNQVLPNKITFGELWLHSTSSALSSGEQFSGKLPSSKSGENLYRIFPCPPLLQYFRLRISAERCSLAHAHWLWITQTVLGSPLKALNMGTHVWPDLMRNFSLAASVCLLGQNVDNKSTGFYFVHAKHCVNHTDKMDTKTTQNMVVLVRSECASRFCFLSRETEVTKTVCGTKFHFSSSWLRRNLCGSAPNTEGAENDSH